ncbi:Ldh family oxidoreductase [Ensifer adhaerens]|uniref:Ldh family oxidoreductase n=1 Tax=Ensifer adhaerens TaxID=106592 RepID=A0A9Q9DEH3_ENSAD|nr:Ldh family oxidoreductase [Ensifer adhaerens]USJ28421.1 Ldh family oxidoreductase [Ensifer adhaerens]
MLSQTQQQTDTGPSLESKQRIAAPVMQDFTKRAFQCLGLPAGDATTIADLIVESDLIGADAHGIFRLPQYTRRLREGGINPSPSITVKRTGGATAMVDGDNGMGHLVMRVATRTAISLARESGVGWVGVRGSNHAGPASLYPAMAVAEGMIGLYTAVASANHMAIWGGSEPLLGTNPLAIGIPAGREAPVILDVATTAVSYGTIKRYALEGLSIPEGWMVDRQTGAPMTDPQERDRGLLLPMGGYKGSGLALVLGLLAGPLNAAAFGREVVDINLDSTSATNTGHAIIALDIKRFVEPTEFKNAVDRFVRDFRQSERLPGVGRIRLPGEDRTTRRQDRLSNGIPMAQALRDTLNDLGASLGIGTI